VIFEFQLPQLFMATSRFPTVYCTFITFNKSISIIIKNALRSYY
jgi:hypothetical protein